MPKVNIHHNAVQKPNAVALSLQEAQWRRLEVVTNNIANAHTPGFKGVFLKLEESHQKNKSKEGRAVSFVHANKQSRNLSNGAFRITGNSLDVGLTGIGFFMVANDKGKFFTRNGQFAKSVKGELVMANSGHAVMGKNGSSILIPLEAKHVAINALGEVYADGNFLGQIGVFTFNNLQDGLKNVGGSLYTNIKGNEPLDAKFYQVRQGGLEESNISAMEESIVMIKILREYENAQKVIDQDDQNRKMMINASQKNV